MVGRTVRWAREHVVVFAAVAAVAYMFLPIAVVAVLSFNQPTSRFNYSWSAFTWDNWANPCAVPAVCESVFTSLQIAALATLASTVLGTLIALALVRYRFRGRSSTNVLIFMPMATPEVVMGASLLALFVNMNLPLGFVTILFAHIMFCISFVVVTVKARISTLDPAIEQAAMDLYATPAQTFARVTLPLIMPGIVAAAMLAFALSFDDFIITNFAAGTGQTVTFPMYVWGAAQRGLPPQVNVIGTLMFLVALVVVLAPRAVLRRRGSLAGLPLQR